MDKEDILDSINKNVQILVNLNKLVYSEKLNEIRAKITEDKVMAKILDVIPEELIANDLVKKVCSEINQKERTVRYRLSELVSMGVLGTNKSGNKSFYYFTGII